MPSSEKSKFHYLHKKLDEIEDEQLEELLREIEVLRLRRIQGQQVVQFLDQSINRGDENGRRKPFDRSEVFLNKYLPMKIGKLMNTEIYKLCGELVELRKEEMLKADHIENYHGTSLYVLLNRAFPDMGKGTKRKKRY